jgi:hypothetical protein
LSQDPSGNKSSRDATIELTLKVGTAALGALYVLGLLVSNLQLMTLGISDFSSLQARNIMIGVVFVLYVISLSLLALPFGVLMHRLPKIWLNRNAGWFAALRSSITYLVVCLLAGLLLASVFGGCAGYFFPWGRSWDADHSLNAWTLADLPVQMQSTYAQFVDAYIHKKMVYVFVALAPSWLPFAANSNGWWQKLDSAHSLRSVASSFVLSLLVPAICLVVLLPLLIAGFAQEVYPNIRYNLGGGQPDVAVLHVASGETSLPQIPQIGLQQDGSAPKQIVETKELIVWYQSPKFMYVSPLTTLPTNDVRLIAIDLNSIRSVVYLQKFVKVAFGGQVLAIY